MHRDHDRKELAKNVGLLFRLRTLPVRIDATGTRPPQLDDEWRLDDVSDNPARIRLRNIATHDTVALESDNVQERRSPNFLLLRCQLTLTPRDVAIEPIAKGSPIGAQNIADRFVSLDYVDKAGITTRLRSEGYAFGGRADEEATRIDLEGWPYVEDVAKDGSLIQIGSSNTSSF